jgi:hypothetical protein
MVQRLQEDTGADGIVAEIKTLALKCGVTLALKCGVTLAANHM